MTDALAGSRGTPEAGGPVGSGDVNGMGGNTDLDVAMGSGNAAGVGGIAESGGAAGNGSIAGTGDPRGAGGIASCGGGIGTGGMLGAGGIVGRGGNTGTAGNAPVACVPACGADADCIAGSCVPRLGMACTTSEDCPSSAICCDGSSEPCDSTRLPADDGSSAGRFTVASDGLTVMDTITGLLWQRDVSGARPGCQTNPTCTWDEAKAYCSGLALGVYGGWRLPALKEMLTIVDFTRSIPAIDSTAFPNTSIASFWTASPFANSGAAWYLMSSSGFFGYNGVFADLRVRCVRGARCYPKTRFVVLPGGLVRDGLTQLLWQQDVTSPRDSAGCSGSKCSWDGAPGYCSSLVLGNQSGFRVPTLKELQSLTDLTVRIPGVAIDLTAFPNTPGDAFWSSSRFRGTYGNPMVVVFSDGMVLTSKFEQLNYLRCVR